MTDLQIKTAQLINGASFVIVSGVSHHVMTAVDSNGFFFASDDDGDEREFHVDSVDHVEVN